jgi:hypothetical protein
MMGKVMALATDPTWQPRWRASGGRSWRATREFYRTARDAEKPPHGSDTGAPHRLIAPTVTDEERKAATNGERRAGPRHLAIRTRPTTRIATGGPDRRMGLGRCRPNRSRMPMRGVGRGEELPNPDAAALLGN